MLLLFCTFVICNSHINCKNKLHNPHIVSLLNCPLKRCTWGCMSLYPVLNIITIILSTHFHCTLGHMVCWSQSQPSFPSCQFGVSNSPHLHVFGQWDEAGWGTQCSARTATAFKLLASPRAGDWTHNLLAVRRQFTAVFHTSTYGKKSCHESWMFNMEWTFWTIGHCTESLPTERGKWIRLSTQHLVLVTPVWTTCIHWFCSPALLNCSLPFTKDLLDSAVRPWAHWGQSSCGLFSFVP